MLVLFQEIIQQWWKRYVLVFCCFNGAWWPSVCQFFLKGRWEEYDLCIFSIYLIWLIWWNNLLPIYSKSISDGDSDPYRYRAFFMNNCIRAAPAVLLADKAPVDVISITDLFKSKWFAIGRWECGHNPGGNRANKAAFMDVCTFCVLHSLDKKICFDVKMIIFWSQFQNKWKGRTVSYWLIQFSILFSYKTFNVPLYFIHDMWPPMGTVGWEGHRA